MPPSPDPNGWPLPCPSQAQGLRGNHALLHAQVLGRSQRRAAAGSEQPADTALFPAGRVAAHRVLRRHQAPGRRKPQRSHPLLSRPRCGLSALVTGAACGFGGTGALGPLRAAVDEPGRGGGRGVDWLLEDEEAPRFPDPWRALPLPLPPVHSTIAAPFLTRLGRRMPARGGPNKAAAGKGLEEMIRAASSASSYSWCTCSKTVCEELLGGRVAWEQRAYTSARFFEDQIGRGLDNVGYRCVSRAGARPLAAAPAWACDWWPCTAPLTVLVVECGQQGGPWGARVGVGDRVGRGVQLADGRSGLGHGAGRESPARGKPRWLSSECRPGRVNGASQARSSNPILDSEAYAFITRATNLS